MMQNAQFKVTGMTSSHSDDVLQKALKDLDGVVYAMASFSDGVVMIQHNGVDRQILIDTIRQAGYDVVQ